MIGRDDAAYEDWKLRARQRDVLEVAQELGAQLKRAGVEWVGPCPMCGGRDRFAVNTRKQVFNCRGASVGGDVIHMVQHVQGVDFALACEILTYEPPPNGRREETDEQRQQREKAQASRLADAQKQRAREAEKEQRRVASHAGTAKDIWRHAVPIAGTPAEAYLRGRGLDIDLDFPSLRFATLAYPFVDMIGPMELPALVCAVVGPELKLRAIWRIFLEEAKGKVTKAQLSTPKLGLGPAGSGGVWLGKPAEFVHVAEGVESSLGVVGLTGGAEPVVATLSTSGLAGFIPPPIVKRVLIWPDSDSDRLSIRDGKKQLRGGPGLKAATTLAQRLVEAGIAAAIQPSGRDGRDPLDHFIASKGKAA